MLRYAISTWILLLVSKVALGEECLPRSWDTPSFVVEGDGRIWKSGPHGWHGLALRCEECGGGKLFGMLFAFSPVRSNDVRMTRFGLRQPSFQERLERRWELTGYPYRWSEPDELTVLGSWDGIAIGDYRGYAVAYRHEYRVILHDPASAVRSRRLLAVSVSDGCHVMETVLSGGIESAEAARADMDSLVAHVRIMPTDSRWVTTGQRTPRARAN